MKIVISKDFSKEPWSPEQGKTFLTEHLLPKYTLSIKRREKLVIDFDGCYGIGTAFLEQAFCGLVLSLQDEKVLKNMEFISQDDETVHDLIKKYVKDASIKLDEETRRVGGLCLVRNDEIASSNVGVIYTSLEKAGLQNISVRELTEEEMCILDKYLLPGKNALFEFIGDYPVRYTLGLLKTQVGQIIKYWDFEPVIRG